ncbi:MAG: thiamine pyrophosphate-binding protein [Verrucomicrobia bacterium]|jgi:acetolactate synthase I/II/III large subunit|nr:thiamine pyrophosphate-binding protein [Verrucomicrobiota bacterium]MBT7065976.1 thiamine pyrophosphate-binding protein [Verrucomicrobiota bacterium]MBT7699280.1 thiamine pyrophosphate-binding protein [Verrucomicrobiota bacterium]
MMRVADYIVATLWSAGAEHVFMVTGRGALFLSDAVAAHKSLVGICLHHEQSAAYAAVAYAQYTERVGACLVSTGCASTNAVTGVLNAWQDGVPCVFVSGQNKLHETSRHTGIPLRTFGQQEADIVSIVEPITKYAVMITDPERIVYEMEKALYLAQSGRKGPVWIDVPLDIQNMRIEPEELEHFVAADDQRPGSPLPEDLQYIAESLREASRPAVLIGGGIRSAGGVQELAAFLEAQPIPVAYSSSAPDTYGADHQLSIGSVGSMGCTRAGNFTVQNSDLLLVLGCRLSSMTTGGTACEAFARDAKVIVVDIDPIEHSKGTVRIDRLVVADVRELLSALMREDTGKPRQEWLAKCQHWQQVFPRCEEQHRLSKKVDLYCVAESLSEALPEDAVVLTDSGLEELILPTNIGFKRRQRCIHPASQGSMGYALPGVVGAHYASGCPVIAVIGDGSIMMNLQELQTIRYHRIPAKIIVINNNAYAIIRRRQVDLFRSRTIGTDAGNGVDCPEFSEVAKCFGFSYQRIESSAELRSGLTAVMDMDGPVLCEIMGLEDQNFIRSSHTRNSEKRIVQRPIEDQAPFLDRDLFLSEMIIEPIDQ